MSFVSVVVHVGEILSLHPLSNIEVFNTLALKGPMASSQLVYPLVGLRLRSFSFACASTKILMLWWPNGMHINGFSIAFLMWFWGTWFLSSLGSSYWRGVTCLMSFLLILFQMIFHLFIMSCYLKVWPYVGWNCFNEFVHFGLTSGHDVVLDYFILYTT